MSFINKKYLRVILKRKRPMLDMLVKALNLMRKREIKWKSLEKNCLRLMEEVKKMKKSWQMILWKILIQRMMKDKNKRNNIFIIFWREILMPVKQLLKLVIRQVKTLLSRDYLTMKQLGLLKKPCYMYWVSTDQLL